MQELSANRISCTLQIMKSDGSFIMRGHVIKAYPGKEVQSISSNTASRWVCKVGNLTFRKCRS